MAKAKVKAELAKGAKLLEAAPNGCQEASPLSHESYIPCNAPAVYMVGWPTRPNEKTLRMCPPCADHNVQNRGGEKWPITPSEGVASAPDVVDASDIEEDEKPSNEQLAGVADLAEAMRKKAKEIEDLEKALKAAQKEFEVIEQDQLPKAMDAIRMRKFTLEDGTEIKVSVEHYANITAANKPAAFKWLRDNKHGGLIKRTIEVAFGMGADKVAEKLIKQILGNKTYKEKGKLSDKIGVHASTLKAWVKEQMEDPASKLKIEQPDCFGIFTIRRAVLNNPTGGKPVKHKDTEL